MFQIGFWCRGAFKLYFFCGVVKVDQGKTFFNHSFSFYPHYLTNNNQTPPITKHLTKALVAVPILVMVAEAIKALAVVPTLAMVAEATKALAVVPILAMVAEALQDTTQPNHQ